MRFIPSLEQSIVDRLAPLRQSGILVRALPDQPAEQGEPLNGEVLVRLGKVAGQESTGLGNVQSTAEAECSLFVRLRNLREGESSAWEVLGGITDYLLGFTPLGATAQMWLRSSDRIGFEHGWWIFEVIMAIPVRFFQNTELEAVNDAIFNAFCLEGTVNDVQVSPSLDYPESFEVTINGDPVLINGDPVVMGYPI